MPDGSTVILCGRRSRKMASCEWCAKPHTALCDAKLTVGVTHDAKLCDDHRTRGGPNIDYCPDHKHLASQQEALFG